MIVVKVSFSSLPLLGQIRQYLRTVAQVFTEWVEKKTAEELRRSSRLNLAACASGLTCVFAFFLRLGAILGGCF